MNGVHDMGGMHGMGELRSEKNEPVFHERWEGRVFAMWRALSLLGKWKGTRSEIERIPAAEYLRMSYYERIVVALSELLVEHHVVTPAELRSGKRARGIVIATPALTAAQVPAFVARGSSSRRDAVVAPRFRAGDRVRARNMNPASHNRLPRYARGKVGTIDRDYGIFVFPDSYVYFLGDNAQHVYSVRFEAHELWGDQARKKADSVYIDMWDDYLDPA